MNEKFASEFSVQLVRLLDQAMDKIEHCLDQLSDAEIWWRPEPDLNSIGNLILHISGNLRQWCVASLNQQPDIRDRAMEFATRSIDRVELLDIVRLAVADAKTAILRLQKVQLLEPVVIQGFNVNRMNALLHTATHFQGHTHQIILLTRLQKKDAYQFNWKPESDRSHVPM